MSRVLYVFSLASGFLALALLALSGPSYRFDVLDLGAAFMLMRVATVLGAVSVPAIIGYSLWRRPEGRAGKALAFSLLAGVSAAYIPLSQLQTARTVPAIHDISTDLNDPPVFVDIVPLRESAPNPPEYAGADSARQQREAYPEVQSLVLEAPLQEVFERAQEVIKAEGLQLVAAKEEADQARIEATDTTFWFGFKDDLVVRLQSTGKGTIVDMRSKSRVGKSDLGVNAERIKSLLSALRDSIQKS